MTTSKPSLRWAATLPFTVFDPPVFTDQLVIVLAARELHAFDAATGVARWVLPVPKASVGLVVAVGEMIIAGWHPWRERRDWIGDGPPADETLTRLIAIDPGGQIRWRAELGTRADLALVVAGKLVIISENGQRFLQTVDCATGDVTTVTTEWQANQVVTARGPQLLASNPWVESGHPGLYTLSAAGVFGQALRYEPIYRVKATAEHIAIMGDGDHEDGGRLAVLDPTTFAERWATQTGSLNLALDEDLVMHTDPAQPRVVVARTATAGTEVWRSVVLDATVETLTPAGGYLFVWTDVGLVALQRATGFVVAPPNSNTSVSAHMGRAYLAGRSLECWNPAAKP
jgi:outer membrane protein assembly factor BamB